MLKKLFFGAAAAAAILACPAKASAEGLDDPCIFNHLGIGVHAATTGFGVELSTPITNYVALRAGVSFMPDFSFTSTVDGALSYSFNGYSDRVPFSMDLDASLKRTQADVIFNIYPFGPRNALYVAAGAYFGGSDVVKVKGHTDVFDRLPDGIRDKVAGITLGDYNIPVDANGNAHGELKVNSFRPYLGIGFGRAVPTRRVNFGVELGVQFMGHMTVWANDEEQTELVTNYADDDWKKWMDKLTVYPVLKFTISGRIF